MHHVDEVGVDEVGGEEIADHTHATADAHVEVPGSFPGEVEGLGPGVCMNADGGYNMIGA
jgi:hypothetical protein